MKETYLSNSHKTYKTYTQRAGHQVPSFKNWVYVGLWYTNSLHVHTIDRQRESLRVALDN